MWPYCVQNIIKIGRWMLKQSHFCAWLQIPIFGVHDSQGSAETLVKRGVITNYRLIAYSFSNISAKNYQNRLMCIEVIVCNVSIVFLRHSVLPECWCNAHLPYLCSNFIGSICCGFVAQLVQQIHKKSTTTLQQVVQNVVTNTRYIAMFTYCWVCAKNCSTTDPQQIQPMEFYH